MIDWTKSDEEILGQLTEQVSKPTHQRVTFGDIARELGDEAYATIVRVFKVAQQADPRLEPAFYALSSTGMEFDTPSRLAMIDQLSVAGYGPDRSQPWPAEWVNKIKAMGVTEGPRWSIELAMGTQPTLATIAAERARNSIVHRANAATAAAVDAHDGGQSAADITLAGEIAFGGGG